VLAAIYASSDRTAEAEALLHALTSHDLSNWHVDEEWLASICLLADTCAILKDTARAPSLYELLLPYAALNAIGIPEFALDSTHRPLGVLATLLGRFEDAEQHFEQALRMNEKMGARPSVAHTQHGHGRLLLTRNAPGDRERAHHLLARAQASYDQLGMAGDVANAAAFAPTG
jgi:tetratricopeptide (TPR) repeat protein